MNRPFSLATFKALQAGALVLLVSVLPACGDDPVELADSGADAGAANIRTSDGKADAGNADAVKADAIRADAEGSGAGNAEAGASDAGTSDASDTDAGPADAPGPDLAARDGQTADTSTVDAGSGDAASIDGGRRDGAMADTIADVSPPTVVSTRPANLAVGVSVRSKLTATFSEAMNPATINQATFTLEQGNTPISGTVSYVGAGSTGTFVPTSVLALDTTYTATLTTSAEDAAGNPMSTPHTWTFTTSACGQAPVALGAAGAFVVLAGSTVTSTGPTVVTGDLGVSPGTAVTGFPPGTVVGAQHPGDPTAAQAVADLTTAYNDAAGRTLCPVTVAGNLGGQTLVPGLYKSTSSLEISSGDLTLDAQGDPDGVFVFQMASTLTTTGGRRVVLSGGAKASNVFWQIGTSATLGTTSAFQGTLMADQAITLGTGATLTGRALARIAAVNLDSNRIVEPAP
jgi:hypothetical protein